jgi:hypothetical protein
MSVTLVRPNIRRAVLAGESLPEWLERHSRKEYILRVALSAPPWVDRKALNELQRKARRRTRETGMLHTLDHIVPVSHPYVCGLTVPWNLRVLPWWANAARGNSFHPDQEEFNFNNEQLRLL